MLPDFQVVRRDVGRDPVLDHAQDRWLVEIPAGHQVILELRVLFEDGVVGAEMTVHVGGRHVAVVEDFFFIVEVLDQLLSELADDFEKGFRPGFARRRQMQTAQAFHEYPVLRIDRWQAGLEC